MSKLTCPECRQGISLLLSQGGEDRPPRAGDAMLCWGCGTALQFDAKLQLELLDHSKVTDEMATELLDAMHRRTKAMRGLT